MMLCHSHTQDYRNEEDPPICQRDQTLARRRRSPSQSRRPSSAHRPRCRCHSANGEAHAPRDSQCHGTEYAFTTRHAGPFHTARRHTSNGNLLWRRGSGRSRWIPGRDQDCHTLRCPIASERRGNRKALDCAAVALCSSEGGTTRPRSATTTNVLRYVWILGEDKMLEMWCESVWA